MSRRVRTVAHDRRLLAVDNTASAGRSIDWPKLIRAATQARANAYAPYSHYLVGAALATGGGPIFSGCNVENASYGLALCAERSALAAMVSQAQRAFDAIVVVTDGPELGAPCGMCRQALYEFAPGAVVGLARPRAAKPERIVALSSLLPEAFGARALRPKPKSRR